VSPDNASATAVNPSALTDLDAWSLTYSHVTPLRGSAHENRYDALWMGLPVSDEFALGFGPEFMRARTPGLPDTNGFVLSAAAGGPVWTWGLSWRFRSPANGMPNVHTADLALSFRPSTTFALSLIGRDLALDTPALGWHELRRSGVLAMNLRPLGDDRLGVELAGLVDEEGDMGLRVTGSAYVPYVGKLAASAERTEAGGEEIWTLTGGVDLRWGSVSAAPAFYSTKEFDDYGWSLMVDLHGAPRPGLPTQKYVAKIEIESLGPRGMLRATSRLDRALHDPRVVGVILQPHDTGAGLAAAQDIRLMIQALKAAGKPVYCYLEAASGSELYMCAGAQRISIDPAGFVRLMGFASEGLYFGEILRNVGVRADFVRIGQYKSAPEQYTNSQPSEPAREVRASLLDDAYRRLVTDLAADRGLPEAEVKALIDRGPFLPAEAIAARLVSSESDRRDLDEDARQLFGARTAIRDQGAREQFERFGPTGQIGVVVLDGTIVDGENVDVPFLDVHMSGGRTVVEAIDRLAADSRIRAIVLRIDSPGGAVMASDQIWRAVRHAREKKPVIASMGDVAASGGYYAACAADEIWASPSTITGSIGIFYGKVDLAPLAERFGVGIAIDKRGAHAGADSMFRPFTDDERAALSGKLRTWYRQFLSRVAEGRKMPIEKVDAVARGRVYSGDQAKALGLVDHLGGFGSALMRARQLAKLGPDAGITLLPSRPSTLLDYVLAGSSAKSADEQVKALGLTPEALKPFLARLYLMTHAGGTTPMALYEGPTTLR
jgi:protease-4